jgi:hypothetical protein
MELMVPRAEELLMFEDDALCGAHFSGGHSPIERQRDRLQPELALAIAGVDVDVRGLVAPVRVEVES